MDLATLKQVSVFSSRSGFLVRFRARASILPTLMAGYSSLRESRSFLVGVAGWYRDKKNGIHFF